MKPVIYKYKGILNWQGLGHPVEQSVHPENNCRLVFREFDPQDGSSGLTLLAKVVVGEGEEYTTQIPSYYENTFINQPETEVYSTSIGTKEIEFCVTKMENRCVEVEVWYPVEEV